MCVCVYIYTVYTYIVGCKKNVWVIARNDGGYGSSWVVDEFSPVIREWLGLSHGSLPWTRGVHWEKTYDLLGHVKYIDIPRCLETISQNHPLRLYHIIHKLILERTVLWISLVSLVSSKKEWPKRRSKTFVHLFLLLTERLEPQLRPKLWEAPVVFEDGFLMFSMGNQRGGRSRNLLWGGYPPNSWFLAEDEICPILQKLAQVTYPTPRLPSCVGLVSAAHNKTPAFLLGKVPMHNRGVEWICNHS